MSAFPLALDDLHIQNGIALRDYFAAKAISIVANNIVNLNNYSTLDRKNGLPEKHAERIAIFSYMIADAIAMLRIRTIQED